MVRFSITCDPAALGSFTRYFLIVKVDGLSHKSVFSQIQDESTGFLLPSFTVVSSSLLVVNLMCDKVHILNGLIEKLRGTEGVREVQFYMPIRVQYDEGWIAKEVRAHVEEPSRKELAT